MTEQLPHPQVPKPTFHFSIMPYQGMVFFFNKSSRRPQYIIFHHLPDIGLPTVVHISVRLPFTSLLMILQPNAMFCDHVDFQPQKPSTQSFLITPADDDYLSLLTQLGDQFLQLLIGRGILRSAFEAHQGPVIIRSEEHTSELQSRPHLV